MSKIIHNELYNSYTKLKQLVNYFKEINRFLKKLKLNVIWLVPEGVILEQKYVKTKKIQLTSSTYGKRKYLTFQDYDLDDKGNFKLNLLKQNLGIVPNIVHSFDAANIRLLVKELSSFNVNINLLTIHDCFATNANNIELLKTKIKIAFLRLYYNKDFLKNVTRLLNI